MTQTPDKTLRSIEAEYPEEGDKCPACEEGKLAWQSHYQDGGCSCHINPPCSYCTDQDLACNKCGEIAVEYEPPSIIASIAKISAVTYKSGEERFKELPDGVFGFVSYPYPGWGMQIKGKLPPAGMTGAEILNACGICEYGIPHFKHWDKASFHLTYTYN